MLSSSLLATWSTVFIGFIEEINVQLVVLFDCGAASHFYTIVVFTKNTRAKGTSSSASCFHSRQPDAYEKPKSRSCAQQPCPHLWFPATGVQRHIASRNRT